MTTTTINRVLLNSADAKKLLLEFSSSLSTLSYSGTIDPLDFGVKSAATTGGLSSLSYSDNVVTGASFIGSSGNSSSQIMLTLTSAITPGHAVTVEYDNDFHGTGPGLMTAALTGGNAEQSGGNSQQYYNSDGFEIISDGSIKLSIPDLETSDVFDGTGVTLTYVNNAGAATQGGATAVTANASSEAVFIIPSSAGAGFVPDDIIEVVYIPEGTLTVDGASETSFAAHKYPPGGIGDIDSVSDFKSSGGTGTSATSGTVEITFSQPIDNTSVMTDVKDDIGLISYASGVGTVSGAPSIDSGNTSVLSVPVSFSAATAHGTPIAVDYDDSNGSLKLNSVSSTAVSSDSIEVSSIQTFTDSGSSGGSPSYDIEHYFSSTGSATDGKADITGVNILVEKNGSFINRENLGTVSDGSLKAFVGSSELTGALNDGVLSVGSGNEVDNSSGSVDVKVQLVSSSSSVLAEDTITVSSAANQQHVIKLQAQGQDLNDSDGSTDNTGIVVTPIDLLTAPTSNDGLATYTLSGSEVIKAYVADNSTDLGDTSSLGTTGQLVTDANSDNKYDFASELLNKSHVKFELSDSGGVIAGNGPLPVSTFKSTSPSPSSDIESVTKSAPNKLDVEFKKDLIKDYHALESEDFTVDNSVAVSTAVFKDGETDIVTLTTAADLPNVDLTVSYNGSNGTNPVGLKMSTGTTTDLNANDSSAIAKVTDGHTTNLRDGSGADAGKLLMQFSNGLTAGATAPIAEDFNLLVIDDNDTANVSDDTLSWESVSVNPTIDGGNIVITIPDSIGSTNIGDIVGAAYDGDESGGASDSSLKVDLTGGEVEITEAEIVNISPFGDIKSVSEVQSVGSDLTVDVTFHDPIAAGVTPQASDFNISTVDQIQTITSDAGASASTAAIKVGTNDTITLKIDSSTDTDATTNSYVGVEYSGTSVKLSKTNTQDVQSSTATLEAPETPQEFSEGSLAGFGSDGNNTFDLATGGFDFSAADSAGDYKAFGGDGNDVATNIDAGDTFIGGDGYDVASVEGKFQDYVFTKVDTASGGDDVYKSEIEGTINTADSVGEINPSSLSNFKDDYINDGSDNVESSGKVGGDPYASTVAEHTIWGLKANDAGDSDGMSVVQAEKIMFEDDPNITIDTNLSTTKIEEKENLASDFGTQTIEFDLDATYDSTQQLFWQIQENKADGATAEQAKDHATLGDFAYTTGYVTVADDANSGSFDILVKNDGDDDEREESFDIKIGYVVGPNKAETVTIGTPKAASGATAVEFEESSNVIVLEQGESGFDTNPSTISVDLGGTATSLTVTATPASADITNIAVAGAGKNDFKDANNALKVLVEDTAGNKVDIGHMINHTDTTTVGATTTPGAATITSYDLAYAASSDNIFLEQATITTQIKADPTEWYVFSGWGSNAATDKAFSGKDFLGQTTTKTINGNDSKSFTTIQSAIDAYSHSDYDGLTQLELRVAEDHEESGTIDVTKNGLFIDFWDVGGTAKDDQMLSFKLDSGVVDLELGGTRNAKVIGNSEDNRIIGNDGDNFIYGKGGNDDILGKGGDDIIFAGKGEDFVDGGAGSDKVYGNQGDDILQATDDAHTKPSVTDAAELSSKDLLSGGSGDDVLIDMANKSAAGKVVMLGGSGKDKISVDSDRSNLDYSGTHRNVLPFDQEDSVVRKIQTKIVDLSKSDKLDTSAIDKSTGQIADVTLAGAGGTTTTLRDGDSKDMLFLLSDLDGTEAEFKIAEDLDLTTGTRSSTSSNGNDTIVNLDSTYGTAGAADGYLYITGMEVPTEKGSGTAAAGGNAAIPPSYFDSDNVHVDAPLQKVEGKIEISHAGEAIIDAATVATVPKTDSAQEVFKDITFELKEIDDQVIFLPTS